MHLDPKIEEDGTGLGKSSKQNFEAVFNKMNKDEGITTHSTLEDEKKKHGTGAHKIHDGHYAMRESTNDVRKTKISMGDQ